MTSFQERLRKGETVLGTMVRDALTVNVVDALLWAGLDFYVLDMEHTSLDLSVISPLLQYAYVRGLAAIVRVPALDKVFINRVLDCGANGVWLPHLDSPEEAQRLAFWAKYPPHGGRGATIPWFKRSKAQGFPKLADFFAAEDCQVVLIGQIESKAAVDHIEDILGTGILDAVVIGPLDLSMDFGVPGEFRHSLVKEAITRVLRAGQKYKISVGMHTANFEDLRMWQQHGMNFLVYSYDLMLMAERAMAVRRELLG